jgi:hypothetical protein
MLSLEELKEITPESTAVMKTPIEPTNVFTPSEKSALEQHTAGIRLVTQAISDISTRNELFQLVWRLEKVIREAAVKVVK